MSFHYTSEPYLHCSKCAKDTKHKKYGGSYVCKTCGSENYPSKTSELKKIRDR